MPSIRTPWDEDRRRRDEIRRQRAEQTSPQKLRMELRRRQMEINQWKSEYEKRESEHLFRLWEITDRLAEKLEAIRDRYAPKTIDEKWSDSFCLAVRMLPDVRMDARELWYAYSCTKGGD